MLLIKFSEIFLLSLPVILLLTFNKNFVLSRDTADISIHVVFLIKFSDIFLLSLPVILL